MIRVSVVIPAYNSAGVIGEALDSVAAQSFDGVEIIVVDDASRDRTCGVVRSWAERHPEIACRLIPLDRNGGPAVARNRGIEEAAGEWIAFLDADDRWMPGRLDTQFRAMAEHPDCVLFCGEARRIETDGAPHEQELRATRGAGGALGLRDFILHNPIATSTVLVRLDVLRDIGGFDSRFRGPEDLDMWLRVAARHGIVMLPDVLAEYRVVTGSLSLDERRFLPEVMRVLGKAFGPGGALAGHPEWRSTAESMQLWNASWMAFSRQDRVSALRYWWRAYRIGSRVPSRTKRASWWLLARYVAGRFP